MLVKRFSKEEIKDAVWECGDDKAPGPDGLTFGFIKHFWELVETDFIILLDYFYVHGTLNRGCNSSFITLVPKIANPNHIKDFRPISLIGCISKVVSKVLANRLKKVISSLVNDTQTAYIEGGSILDGPLIINELVSWGRKCKKKMLLFKVDFEKAFDSLNWDFLLSVLTQMGFPALWRKWILGILSTSRTSILVNGSPTLEFNVQRGVRQGDPLSPLLFILAMEALHVVSVKANSLGIFDGVKTPNDGPTISHLLYADDVLFVGEWSEKNFNNLARLLRCFHLSSGLKVNFNKSHLYGIGVSNEEIGNMASILHCTTGSFPFTYLGLPVGGNMGLVKNWKPIIERFEGKLTLLKARTLSFGGRVTLIEAVLGNLPTYYLSLFNAPAQVIKHLERLRRKFLWGGCTDKNKISWAPWYKVVAPKEDGGLGIGSLVSANKALMVKWRMRYKNENSTLWAKIITAIHGGERWHSSIPLKSSIGGIWKSIINMGRVSSNPVIDAKRRMIPKMGRGDKTLFWLDTWVGDRPLREVFPALYALESEKRCMVLQRYTTTNTGIVWLWGSANDLTHSTQQAEWAACVELLQSTTLGSGPDFWLWKMATGCDVFTVKSLRAELDHISFIPETKGLVWLH
ncbi:putative RNA-directed DNA polymerase [Helianthus annuus]|nr:putative RNA-directed DNA polymerase [Helianthus annuus]